MNNVNIKKSKDIKYFVESLSNVDRLGHHPLGLALKNIEKQLCYVLIPKNASTSLSASFASTLSDDWIPDIVTDSIKIKKFIVVLRDPVDRFISAANMFLTTSRFLIDTYKESRNGLHIIKDDQLVTTDCHFAEQHKFISFIPKSNIDFFYFNDNIVNDINKHYDLTFVHSPRFNVTKKLVTSVNEELIKTIYQKDYELINSVKFVNKPMW